MPKIYAVPYKFREDKDSGNHMVKHTGTPFEVRARTEYIQLNGAKLDKGGHPTGHIIGSKSLEVNQSDNPSSINTTLNESLNFSLKNQLAVLLTDAKALVVRLNSIKELRESQKKKTPISPDHLKDLVELNEELKSLIDSTKQAIELSNLELEKKKAQRSNTLKIYDDFAEIQDWLLDLK